MAQIILTEKECIEMFYYALCNGIQILDNYGLELDWSQEEYIDAKNNLLQSKPDETICREDVWMQILKDGGVLRIIDHEGEGDNDSTITLKDVIERVPKTPIQHLVDILSENGDATTADVILQTVFYEEVIFG